MIHTLTSASLVKLPRTGKIFCMAIPRASWQYQKKTITTWSPSQRNLYWCCRIPTCKESSVLEHILPRHGNKLATNGLKYKNTNRSGMPCTNSLMCRSKGGIHEMFTPWALCFLLFLKKIILLFHVYIITICIVPSM